MNNRRKSVLAKPDPRSRLGERISQIVGLRDDGLLLWEIAERIGVTKERIRQILAKARAMGAGPKPPSQVVTRQASILLGMSPEIRPGSFQRLMAKFGVVPVASKRGRLYWNVGRLLKIEPPKCVVCQSPVPVARYIRSATCSRQCSNQRRSQYTSRRRDQLSAAGSAQRGSRTKVRPGE